MNKPLQEMSDAEFFIECANLLAAMCDRMKTAHLQIAEFWGVAGNNEVVRPILEFSMYTCLEGVGNILNGIDLVDDSAEQSAPIFAELHRRFPK
jgi:hypothetical protein